MAKKFHVDARSKGIIKAGVNPKGLQKWKTSEDPRAVRQGVPKTKIEEVSLEAKVKPKKQKVLKEEKNTHSTKKWAYIFSGRF